MSGTANDGASPAAGGPEPHDDAAYAILDRSVDRYPDRIALSFFESRLTYRELGDLVARAAEGLQRLGVGKGVHVGLCLPNTPYSVIFFFAVLKAGGVVVNYNPLYVERELTKQIADSRTVLMVALDSPQILPKIAGLVASGELERMVVCPMGLFLPGAPAAGGIVPDDRHIAYERLIGTEGRPAPVAITPDRDIAILQYTGGTTGVPKGAMLLHANLLASTRQVLGLVPTAQGDQERILMVLPLFHIFALTTGMSFGIAAGAELILIPRFDAAQVMECIQSRRPTMFPGVPTMYTALNSLAATGQWDLSSLRYCISGGAPLPAEVRRRFEQLTGCTLVEGYGLSEANPSTCNPLTGGGKDGSIGLPVPFSQVEIRSTADPGKILPVGEMGEICIRGPQVMAGYWQRPEEEGVFADGALRTGDIGYQDGDGYVFLVDRMKDVILCGGYNVYPRVIEEALYQHPAVAEAVVVGLPDSYRGQSPKAYVRLRDGAAVTAEELKTFLAGYVSPIEMPKWIELRGDLPKTTVGKLDRKRLVAEETGAGREEEGGRA
ncbi:MAG: long-chain fatty acid--CoA ligase [Telmatospirillum sp.]|nr:long-chain fatty acid--CoA ligase [Telmatospirillum sp.]